nr:putative ABC transporter permease [Maliibacterium massiliense]
MWDEACRLFLYFLAYSVLGWVCESVYCSIPAKKCINRGFLAGPLCPIYGFGAVAVALTLAPFAGNVALVFCLGLLLTSALEYVTSWLMEKAFHMKWWDYSARFCNIRGRVCLKNSVMFGVMSVLVVQVLHPQVVRLVALLPQAWLYALAGLFACALALDFVSAVRATLQISGRLAAIQRVLEEMRAHTAAQGRALQQDWDARREAAQSSLELLHARLEELARANRRAHRRLLDAFPHLHAPRYSDAVARVRQTLEQLRAQRRHRGKDGRR